MGGVDAWKGQPLLPPKAWHTPLVGVEPPLALTPEPSKHQTVHGWRSSVHLTQVHIPLDYQVSTSHPILQPY